MTRYRGLMFRSALTVADFRWLWAGEALSQAGDQLARVALAVLVYDRTSSAALTALGYALTFVPTMVGGALLGWVADQVPRRTVLVVCDLGRAVLVALMSLPGTPLPVLYGLLVVVTLLGGPFRAAQQALLPDVLAGERYVAGLALRGMTIQGAQLAGFAGGGALVAALTPYWALVVDAGTFVASAVLVGVGVRHPSAVTTPGARRSARGSVAAGLRVVFRDPAVRALAVLSWLAGFYVVPEGLAAPYAAAIGTGTVGVGLLMAGDPAGSVVGAFAFTRWVPARLRPRLIGLLGVLTGVPLLFCAFAPGLVWSVVLFAVSGALAQAYQTQDTASLARTVPSDGRAQVMGLVVSGLVTVQGLGVLLAGVLASFIGTPFTIALAGAAGIAVGLPAALAWRRADRPAR